MNGDNNSFPRKYAQLLKQAFSVVIKIITIDQDAHSMPIMSYLFFWYIYSIIFSWWTQHSSLCKGKYLLLDLFRNVTLFIYNNNDNDGNNDNDDTNDTNDNNDN